MDLQPEGYEVKSSTNEKLVLEESLYGLKPSGRNWNQTLHKYLSENDFVQNPADHCVYTRETENEKAIMIKWVDDVIIAAGDENALKVVKETSQKRYAEKILDRFDTQDCKPRAPTKTELH